MNQDEFENWLKALDMYEFIDWLFPEVVEEEFNEEMYNAQINLYIQSYTEYRYGKERRNTSKI